MDVYLLIAMFRIDWNKSADEMRKSIGAPELEEDVIKHEDSRETELEAKTNCSVKDAEGFKNGVMC